MNNSREKPTHLRYKNGIIVAISVAMVVYLLVFLAMPFEPYSSIFETPYPRILFFTNILVLDDYFGTWLGPAGQFGLLDRASIFLIALVMLFAAAGVGHLFLLQKPFAALRDKLTQLETTVFATVIGLSCFSIFFLLLGAFGLANHRVLVWVTTVLFALCATIPNRERLTSPKRATSPKRERGGEPPKRIIVTKISPSLTLRACNKNVTKVVCCLFVDCRFCNDVAWR